jgi:hypothetical protein
LTRTTDAEAATQLGSLIDWAKAKARNSDDVRERSDWQDMANVVERARTYSNIKAIEVASPELAASLDSVTRGELIAYAMAKVKGPAYVIIDDKVAKVANVSVIKGRSVTLKTKDGGYYNGGILEDRVDAIRKELVNYSSLSKFLSNSQIDLLGGDSKALKGLSRADRQAAIDKQLRLDAKFQSNVKAVADVFMSQQGIIKIGGASGDSRPSIFLNIESRLRARTEDSLLGRSQPAVVKPNSASQAVPLARMESLENGVPESTKLLKEWKEAPSRLDAPAQNVSDILDFIIAENNSIPVTELPRLRALRDAYKDPTNPEHARALKMIHDLMLGG